MHSATPSNMLIYYKRIKRPFLSIKTKRHRGFLWYFHQADIKAKHCIQNVNNPREPIQTRCTYINIRRWTVSGSEANPFVRYAFLWNLAEPWPRVSHPCSVLPQPWCGGGGDGVCVWERERKRRREWDREIVTKEISIWRKQKLCFFNKTWHLFDFYWNIKLFVFII